MCLRKYFLLVSHQDDKWCMNIWFVILYSSILSEQRGWVSRLASQLCVSSAVLFCVWCTAVILSWCHSCDQRGLRSVLCAWHPQHHHNTAGGCCRRHQLTAVSETSVQNVSTQSTLASSPCLVMVSRWVITRGLGSSWTHQTSRTQPTWQCPAPPALATWTRPSTGRWPRSVTSSLWRSPSCNAS